MSALIWHHSLSELPRSQAKRIIQDVGSTGQPPIFGYQLFSAGLDPWLITLEEEYLKDYIRSGGSAFKLVTGTYGEGKTHFLYSVRGLAWMHNYVSSYIELKPDETPLHNLESVYRS
ncbi:MAG: BREX system ATP-binding domain-containing protein, partial [Methanoregula sp.]